MIDRSEWNAINMLAHLALCALLLVAVFALLFKFLPGHPAWAAAVVYVALAVVFGSVARAGVLVHRLTRHG